MTRSFSAFVCACSACRRSPVRKPRPSPSSTRLPAAKSPTWRRRTRSGSCSRNRWWRWDRSRRRLTAPFVTISPAIPGAFRWSGTTILIFTPDATRPLPYATRYDVTVAASATAVSGRRLEKPVTFSFTTPTVKLLSTTWYRRDGTVDGPMVVVLRFNQPVRSADVSAALTAALKPHEWTAPSFSPQALQRLKASDPGSSSDSTRR